MKLFKRQDKKNQIAKEETHKRFWYGSGITIDKKQEIVSGVLIRPVTIKGDVDSFKKRATSQREYGIICALADTITFEVEVFDECERTVAVKLWNSQWALVLLSVITGAPISAPLNGLIPSKITMNLLYLLVGFI